jgi:hypothetical protein
MLRSATGKQRNNAAGGDVEIRVRTRSKERERERREREKGNVPPASPQSGTLYFSVY